MKSRLAKEAEKAKDALGLKSYSDAFEALRKTTNGRLSSGNWELVFSATSFGFHMVSKTDKEVIYPTCPVSACRNYTYGLHFCQTHFVKKSAGGGDGQSTGNVVQTSLPDSNGTVIDEKVIRMLMGKLESLYKIGYRGSEDPDLKNSLYEAVRLNPYDDGIYTVKAFDKKSYFRIACKRTGDVAFSCASKKECYKVSNRLIEGNYYCDDHHDELIDATNPAMTTKDLTRKRMFIGMRRLVEKFNGGEKMESNAIGTEDSDDSGIISPNLQKCFKQWRKFLRAIILDPAKGGVIVEGQLITFTFVNKKLGYRPGVKTGIKSLNICLFPGCGTRTGSSRKTATQFCGNPDHERIGRMELAKILKD